MVQSVLFVDLLSWFVKKGPLSMQSTIKAHIFHLLLNRNAFLGLMTASIVSVFFRALLLVRRSLSLHPTTCAEIVERCSHGIVKDPLMPMCLLAALLAHHDVGKGHCPRTPSVGVAFSGFVFVMIASI